MHINICDFKILRIRVDGVQGSFKNHEGDDDENSGQKALFTLRHRCHAGGRQTKDRSLARFACPPAFVHFTSVICVSRDCMKTTYRRE